MELIPRLGRLGDARLLEVVLAIDNRVSKDRVRDGAVLAIDGGAGVDLRVELAELRLDLFGEIAQVVQAFGE